MGELGCARLKEVADWLFTTEGQKRKYRKPTKVLCIQFSIGVRLRSSTKTSVYRDGTSLWKEKFHAKVTACETCFEGPEGVAQSF